MRGVAPTDVLFMITTDISIFDPRGAPEKSLLQVVINSVASVMTYMSCFPCFPCAVAPAKPFAALHDQVFRFAAFRQHSFFFYRVFYVDYSALQHYGAPFPPVLEEARVGQLQLTSLDEISVINYAYTAATL